MILTEDAYNDLKRRWPEIKRSGEYPDYIMRELARLFEPKEYDGPLTPETPSPAKDEG